MEPRHPQDSSGPPGARLPSEHYVPTQAPDGGGPAAGGESCPSLSWAWASSCLSCISQSPSTLTFPP
jgi:hypothetical protein